MSEATAARLLEALRLPSTARVDRRIPKTALIEPGATRAADKKLVEEGIARLDWLAELSPATTGIPPRADPPAPAVNILLLAPQGEPKLRLLEVIHRAIPAPVLLVTVGAEARLSLAVRRQGADGHSLVMDPLLRSPPFEGVVAEAFLASLGSVPRLDLGLFYDGLIERVEAWEAAVVAGAPFRIAASRAEAEARRLALARWRAAEAEWKAAAAAAKQEKRLGHAVALGEVARQKRQVRDAIARELA